MQRSQRRRVNIRINRFSLRLLCHLRLCVKNKFFGCGESHAVIFLFMISVEEALNIILSEVKPLGLERVSLLESLGRVLAEAIYAAHLIPPKDNSAMDGYAVRAEDVIGASKDTPKVLRVTEDLPAGYIAKKEVKKGEAIRIMTGAPIPAGADAVVMLEDTKILKDATGEVVEVFYEVKKGENIRMAGEDVRPGDLVVKKGVVLSPGEVGMIASVGKAFINVYQRPRVSILATGDELVEVDEPLTEGKIINSNGYSLYAQVLSANCIPLNVGIARDNKKSLREKLTFALTGDVVVSSGGVSVGDYDYVKDVLKEMGTEMRFWKVAIKPGKPLAFGIISGKPTFGLPGNPVSSMIAFEEFVRPALLKMMGMENIYRKTVDAVLGEDIKKKPRRKHFIQSRIEEREGMFYAFPLKERGSGILSSMVKCQGLVCLNEDVIEAKAGDRVKVQILREEFLCQKRPGY